jgi:hypothetical protein
MTYQKNNIHDNIGAARDLAKTLMDKRLDSEVRLTASMIYNLLTKEK